MIIFVFVNRSLTKIYKHLLSENFLFYNQCCSPYTPIRILPCFLRIRSRLGALSEPHRVSVLNTLEGELRKESRRISDL
ncbi:hypothetical protein DW698_03660 [Lachnospiraceae bacterium AM26-1LB]|nr:hypothetical protein F2Y14_01620 [Anaerostipes hadrus]RHU03922.1 hypothetical protein DW698_03660 [Lachnospiraceae bacterium AM26-1LB]